MTLSVDNVIFHLDKCNSEVALKLQDEIDQILVVAVMIGYNVNYGYNQYAKQLHCYFKDNLHNYKFTLSLHHDKEYQFTQYSILIYDMRKSIYREPIYRKRGSSSFFKVLKNLKKML